MQIIRGKGKVGGRRYRNNTFWDSGGGGFGGANLVLHGGGEWPAFLRAAEGPPLT